MDFSDIEEEYQKELEKAKNQFLENKKNAQTKSKAEEKFRKTLAESRKKYYLSIKKGKKYSPKEINFKSNTVPFKADSSKVSLSQKDKILLRLEKAKFDIAICKNQTKRKLMIPVIARGYYGIKIWILLIFENLLISANLFKDKIQELIEYLIESLNNLSNILKENYKRIILFFKEKFRKKIKTEKPN